MFQLQKDTSLVKTRLDPVSIELNASKHTTWHIAHRRTGQPKHGSLTHAAYYLESR